jgi:hypothetical protein
MVWVYENTESALVMMLMHTSLITFWLISTPAALTPERMVIWYIAWGSGLWLTVAILRLARVLHLHSTVIRAAAG